MTLYMCLECERVLPGWRPACPFGCRGYKIGHAPAGTEPDPLPVREEPVAAPPRVARPVSPPKEGIAPVSITEIEESTHARYQSGIAAFDDVLGGGIVVGSVLALVAAPGLGKTSLLLQALAGIGEPTLYATGEESIEQVAATARRIGADVPSIYIAHATDVDAIVKYVRAHGIRILVADSVQMTQCVDIKGMPGSPTQLTESIRRLADLKNEGVTVCLVSQVTGDGDAKGGTFLLHYADVLLELVMGTVPERVLRCIGKNRNGADHVARRLVMTPDGLRPPTDPEPEPDFEEAAPRRQRAIGAELGDSVDGELPDTVVNRLLRAAIRLADIRKAEADIETIGGGALALSQRFGLATDELHEAAVTFADSIPDQDRRRLGA